MGGCEVLAGRLSSCYRRSNSNDPSRWKEVGIATQKVDGRNLASGVSESTAAGDNTVHLIAALLHSATHRPVLSDDCREPSIPIVEVVFSQFSKNCDEDQIRSIDRKASKRTSLQILD